MAFYDSTWYINFGDGATTGYYLMAKRPQNTAVSAGQMVRQFTAPAVGSERAFACIVAGTTANVTDATWVLTRGAKTTDGGATWIECTGASAVNGDLANTPNWTFAKATGNPSVGAIIKRNNGASYQVCTTGGALGASEPAFSDTAGVTTTDSAAVWTSLGAVGNFTGGQAPHARLANVFGTSWFAAGNTAYVGGNHAESQATAITITATGSASTVGRIICHNQAASYPPTSSNLATTATISTTATATITINPSGPFYFYGMTFRPGVGVSGTAGLAINGTGAPWFYFDACSLRLASTGAGSQIGIGTTTGNFVTLNNTTVSFAAAGQYLNPQPAKLIWQNTGTVLFTGSTVPTSLFSQNSSGTNQVSVVLEALDLSQITGNIVSTASGAAVGDWLIKDCKLNGSATIATPLSPGMTVQLVRSTS